MDESVFLGDSKAGSQNIARWRFIPWVIAACCLIGLIWVRMIADLGDFGFRNVLTYLLAIAGSFSTLVALMLTARRIVWLTALLLPIALGGVFFGLYRLDRVDSEIVPKFVWRWNESAALPETQLNADAAIDDFFTPRETDFPKFMGPNANSTLPSIELETNWQAHEPKIQWQQPIGKGWSGFAVQGNAAYTMEQREQEEWVTCYDADSGRLLWHYAIPGLHFNPLGGTGPRATPTIYDGCVYAQSAVSELVCLDMRTGEKVWSADLLKLAGSSQAAFESEVAWGRSSSPLIVDGKVVVPLGGSAVGGSAESMLQSLVAFDAKSGAELWRAGGDQISYSTPVEATLLGERQILYSSEMRLSGHAIADGAVLWAIDWPSGSSGDANVSQPIVIDSSHVLLTKGYGGGAKLLELTKSESQWTPKSIWKVEGVLRTKFTSCVVRDGHAFGLSDGILECVDLSNGKRSWKKGRYRHGQVLLVGDTLVITAEDGSVVLVAADADEFRELAKLAVIGDVTWNTAALSGNRLLMRNSDEAACVILPLKSPSPGVADSAPPATQESTSE